MSTPAQTANPPETEDAAPKKSKRERFEAYAAKRTDAVVDALRRLKNCANPQQYEYSEAEREQIIEIVGDAYAEMVQAFRRENTPEQRRRLVLDPSEVTQS